ncbi:hypothetical protein IT413_03655 [Candidatus Peregrinibacteria bacterium]|nr:hypothetical protein [Candidatus Peregrinibacteria bacterium]
MNIQTLHNKFIEFSKNYQISFSRIALFIIFFWFGILKVIGTSPANPLVAELLSKTLWFIGPNEFFILFGIFEILIGICFLFRKLNPIGILLLIPHMFTTVMPLILLPQITWQGFMTPTLEGQYIIKNLVIITTAMGLGANFSRSTKIPKNK